MKAKLTSMFSMADIGPINFYLGIKVERDREKKIIKLSQSADIDKVLAKFHFDKAYPVNTSIKESAFLQSKIDGKAFTSEKKQY